MTGRLASLGLRISQLPLNWLHLYFVTLLLIWKGLYMWLLQWAFFQFPMEMPVQKTKAWGDLMRHVDGLCTNSEWCGTGWALSELEQIIIERQALGSQRLCFLLSIQGRERETLIPSTVSGGSGALCSALHMWLLFYFPDFILLSRVSPCSPVWLWILYCSPISSRCWDYRQVLWSLAVFTYCWPCYCYKTKLHIDIKFIFWKGNAQTQTYVFVTQDNTRKVCCK